MSMQEGQRRFTEKTVADLKNGCNVTIVAFGDSITAGFAVRRGFPSFGGKCCSRSIPKRGWN